MKETGATGFGESVFGHGRMTDGTGVSSDAHGSEFPRRMTRSERKKEKEQNTEAREGVDNSIVENVFVGLSDGTKGLDDSLFVSFLCIGMKGCVIAYRIEWFHSVFGH